MALSILLTAWRLPAWRGLSLRGGCLVLALGSHISKPWSLIQMKISGKVTPEELIGFMIRAEVTCETTWKEPRLHVKPDVKFLNIKSALFFVLLLHNILIKSLIHLYIQLSSDRLLVQSFSDHLPFTLSFNNMVVPNYCRQMSLLLAKERIKNPPIVQTDKGFASKPFEHHVGSWALTMLNSVFHGDNWIITPEKADDYSKKRPDLVVEKVSSDTESKHHLFMELKATNGDRMEDALSQIVSEIEQTMEHTIETYDVVQRGTKIAFFEYHNDVSNLDEEEIPHFKGCISLTQSYIIEDTIQEVLEHKPIGLLPLYHDYKHLRKDTETRKEALEYTPLCVLDLDNHEKEINFLFHYMANHEPRSSVWVMGLSGGIGLSGGLRFVMRFVFSLRFVSDRFYVLRYLS